MQKQEECVAKLVRYLNYQDLKFTTMENTPKTIFCGNIWGVTIINGLSIHLSKRIMLSAESHTILDVDDFVYDVYLPRSIASSLKDLIEGNSSGDEKADGYIVLQTKFPPIDRNKMPYQVGEKKNVYSTKILVGDFVENACKLRLSIITWYHSNGIDSIDMTYNLIDIDKTNL